MNFFNFSHEGKIHKINPPQILGIPEHEPITEDELQSVAIVDEEFHNLVKETYLAFLKARGGGLSEKDAIARVVNDKKYDGIDVQQIWNKGLGQFAPGNEEYASPKDNSSKKDHQNFIDTLH